MKYDLKCFSCLEGKDVISAKISDHHPVVHNGFLFWNVMMQANTRRSKEPHIVSYNNAFGMIEDQKTYHNRLVKISWVIAEIIFFCSSIKVIALCEGPKAVDSMILLNSLKQFSFMHKFFPKTQFHRPHFKNALDWGLLMLATNDYTVKNKSRRFSECSTITEQLANRFQIWKLSQANEKMYLCLAHFPFNKDERVENPKKFSSLGKQYIYWINFLVNKYSNKLFVLCADFNFNPFLMGNYQDRLGDHIPIHNSALLTPQEKKPLNREMVTVDGILLSHKFKQKYFSSFASPNLFRRLVLEHKLFQSHVMGSITDTLKFKFAPPLCKGYT